METCSICGNNDFGPGPNGRKSFDGHSLPRCTKCQSLERHRALRNFWERFPKDFLENQTVLQFSPDKSVEPQWFRNYEVSVYGGKNSIDIQNINRPDNSYDIIICVHVLEHIENDKLALKEMLRIIKPSGFILLAVPDPFHREKTIDWGFPKDTEHGHYRIYGHDINALLFDKVIHTSLHQQVLIEDRVTNSQDFIYLISKNHETITNLKEFLQI